MIDIKPIVMQALESHQALVDLVGRDKDGNVRIYQRGTVPYADEFPRITFFEYANYDNEFADDEEIGSLIAVQVDIWHKGSTAAITKAVDKTMKAAGFRRTSAADLYEDDTKVFHKGLRYQIQMIIDEEG